jgi:hypothetical protein
MVLVYYSCAWQLATGGAVSAVIYCGNTYWIHCFTGSGTFCTCVTGACCGTAP